MPRTLRLRPKLHRFDLSLYLLQCCCITDNESIKRSLSIIVQICVNNRHCLIGLHCNLLSTDARCLVIILGAPCNMVDFTWSSVARSIGVSRYTCLLISRVAPEASGGPTCPLPPQKKFLRGLTPYNVSGVCHHHQQHHIFYSKIFHIYLDRFPSFCQKLSKLVEIWRSSDENKYA